MIPLYKPFMPELPDLDRILHSGALAYGKYAKMFEDKLKGYFGTPYLMVTSSFNNAVSIALAASGILPNDSVIASPMACLVSTQPYLSNGLKVCWADVDPTTGTLSPDSVRRQIKLGVKAIIHNHFCGYPGYIDEINLIGKENGIIVIDDGIECFGTEYKGKKIGNCGTDVTVFSLTAVRIPNCIDGGIVIFKDKESFAKGMLIRDCGIDRKIFRDNIGEINPNCDINLIGYSATLSDVNGYIGLMQMEQVNEIILKQRKNAKRWDEVLLNESFLKPLQNKNGNPNYWIYGTVAQDKRETILYFREKGYYASGVHINNNIYSIFGKQDIGLSGVDEFYRGFVALPCGWWMKNED